MHLLLKLFLYLVCDQKTSSSSSDAQAMMVKNHFVLFGLDQHVLYIHSLCKFSDVTSVSIVNNEGMIKLLGVEGNANLCMS